MPIHRTLLLILLLLLTAAAALLAQNPPQGAGELPTLEIDQVVITRDRTIALPPAKKGEVYDSTIYRLPAGDTVIFGERVSNLARSGGALPTYREFTSPLAMDLEASLGSYLSPRALLRAEYQQRTFDVGGMIDYRGTEGHLDSARAGSILLQATGGLLIGADEITPARFRAAADLSYLGDSYFLYGSRTGAADRSRSTTRWITTLESQEDQELGIGLKLDIGSTSVRDRLRDTVREASGLTPAFAGRVSYGSDSLRISGGIEYMTTSLDYGTPTQTPAYLHLRGDVEWRPAERFYLSLGGFYANGEFSDSGAATVVSGRVTARYVLSPQLSVVAWFTPELRPAAYRDMLMRAPYVAPAITLRPESVPIRLGGGVRVRQESFSIEARVVIEQAENTPVVVADTAGELRYDYVNSRTVGGQAAMQMKLIEKLHLDADLFVGESVNRADDQLLPMRPSVDLRARAEYAITEQLSGSATLQFQTEQRTVIAPTNIPSNQQTVAARFLLGAGANYRLNDNFQAFAEATNLLGLKYDLWHGYEAPGIELRAGVRVKF
ncbi:MAG: hypothetical protein IPM61_07695 [Chlorobi bacterium]|nr:hypothetical protein [Chlorobiota bacterium]MBX7218252.1 hypothetical protein [Candidatus Kapabacteria bacterium]